MIFTSLWPAWKETSKAERFHIFLSLSVFIILACWSIFFVPMNNDEGNNYHTLACLYYPMSHIGASFQECGKSFDWQTPFGFSLHRSNPFHGLYYGMTAPLLYAPIYFLFHFPAAQYGFGLICFILFCMMMARLTRKPLLSFAVLLSFFPFVFNFIQDMGPVHNAILAFPISVWLLRRLTTAQGFTSYVYATLLGAMLALGVEEKIFFIYLIPSIGFFMIAFLGRDSHDNMTLMARSWRPLVWAGIVFLMLLGSLFLSVKETGRYQGLYYINWLLMNMKQNLLPMYDMATIPMNEKWFRFLVFWPHYAGRFFMTDLIDSSGNFTISFGTLLAIIAGPCLLFATGLGFYVVSYLRKNTILFPHRLLFLILCFLAYLVTFNELGNVWAGHHFVFIWIPLIILLCELLPDLTGLQLLFVSLLFAVTNLVPLLWLSQMPLHYEVSRERSAISKYFTPETSAAAIIGYQSWGYHHLHRNYGPLNQMVFLSPLGSYRNIHRVEKILDHTGRTLYVVCRIPDPTNSAETFAGNSCTKAYIEGAILCGASKKAVATDVLPDLKVWHIYKIIFDKTALIDHNSLGCHSSIGLDALTPKFDQIKDSTKEDDDD